MIKTCLQCKKEYKSRGKIRNKSGKYCSKLCMAEVQKTQSNWNKGKSWSKKQKEKLSEAHLGQKSWNKGTKGLMKVNKTSFKKGDKINLGRIASLEARKKMSISKIENPVMVFRDTSIELKVEAELIKRGINYQKQVPLCKIARVDFYLPEYRIVIQADGCYWHNCPIHGKDRFTKSVEKDIKQDKVLTFNGFNVYRFWEHQINKSVEECINSLILTI